MDQKTPQRRLNTWIPTELAEELARTAKQLGLSRRDVAVAALERYLGCRPIDRETSPGVIFAELAEALASWARQCRRAVEPLDDPPLVEIAAGLLDELERLITASLVLAQIAEDEKRDQPSSRAALLARGELAAWLAEQKH